MRKNKIKILVGGFLVCIIAYYVVKKTLSNSSEHHECSDNQVNWLIEESEVSSSGRRIQTNFDVMDFEGFDNNLELDIFRHRAFLVPNIVHLIYLNLDEIKFYQCINIYSIFLNQKPEKIYIHCDRCEFSGFYWDQLNSIEEIKRMLVINKIDRHDTIFGQRVRWIQHRLSKVNLIPAHLILNNIFF